MAKNEPKLSDNDPTALCLLCSQQVLCPITLYILCKHRHAKQRADTSRYACIRRHKEIRMNTKIERWEKTRRQKLTPFSVATELNRLSDEATSDIV
ncbi:hypothetical protein LOAG_13295 [Loa loa]|uniref:HTH_Tnp_ISL3 domain-containing protein n=1 Tax=Loa loa TaxID=7209 RepID=A0A1I7VPZ5_LOALO|nr:hypothetical protein LOAG_13295 [Loa loa]EFO15218.2 hypothetical protein LOAG_13295 [Loa loa]